jgi:hypothetical protein
MRFQPSHHSYGASSAADAAVAFFNDTSGTPSKLTLKKGDSDSQNTGGQGGTSTGNKRFSGEVKHLQNLLRETDLLTAEATGLFWTATEDAVKKANRDIVPAFRAAVPTAPAAPTNSAVAEAVTWAALVWKISPDAQAAIKSAGAGASAASAPAASGGAPASSTSSDAKKSADKKGSESKRGGKLVARREAERQAEESREMWKNVAIWGGVAVAGIGAVILIVKSLGKEGN